jgi:hypothetical protein
MLIKYKIYVICKCVAIFVPLFVLFWIGLRYASNQGVRCKTDLWTRRQSMRNAWVLMCAADSRIPPSYFVNSNGDPTISWRLGWQDEFVRFNDLRSYSWKSAELRRFDSTDNGWRTDFCQAGKGSFASIFAVVDADTAMKTDQMRWVSSNGALPLPNDLITLLEVSQETTHWMEPGDISLSGILKSLQPETEVRLGCDDKEFFVAFFDGQIWILKGETPRELVARFCAITGATQLDREIELSPYRISIEEE